MDLYRMIIFTFIGHLQFYSIGRGYQAIINFYIIVETYYNTFAIFFLFILQFENVRDIPAPLRMNTPHRRNIVALVPPLLGSEEETYPKNPSKFLKSGFMIIAIMRIQVTGKRLLLREKPTSPFCKFVTGLSMLEDAYFLK